MKTISQNLPTVVTGVIGAVVAAVSAGWVSEELVIELLGMVAAVGGIAGAAAGKMTQVKTWAEDSHKQAVAYALSLDPEEWDIEKLIKRLGFEDLNEVRRQIGADEE